MKINNLPIDDDLGMLISYETNKKKNKKNRLYLTEELDTVEIALDYYSNKISILYDKEEELEENEFNRILSDYNHMIEELSHYKREVLQQTILAYINVLDDYYISIEDITSMLGVNVQYVKSRMQSDLHTLEIHRTVRQWIKQQKRLAKFEVSASMHPLLTLVDSYHIDIDKKILISKSSLYAWCRDHLTTTNGLEVPGHIINEILKHRYLTSMGNKRLFPFLCSLRTYKELKGFTHDAQLYRKHKKTFCLYNNHANKPLARFCISPSVVSEVELLEYRELKKGKTD